MEGIRKLTHYNSLYVFRFLQQQNMMHIDPKYQPNIGHPKPLDIDIAIGPKKCASRTLHYVVLCSEVGNPTKKYVALFQI